MPNDRSGEPPADLSIPSEVSCPTCSITIEPVVSLEGAYFDGPEGQIVRDSAGTIFLVNAGDQVVRKYGSDGRFIRQIGRRGGGPGEYESVRNILAAQDGSIRILDGVLGRLSTFSGDGEFLGSTNVVAGGMGMAAILLPDGQLVFNARPLAGVQDGAVVLSVDTAGTLTTLIDNRSVGAGKRWLNRRLLWGRANGEFLVARPYVFTIDVYTSELVKKRSIARVAKWIPSHDPEEVPSDGLFDTPPTAQLTDIWEDAEGRLWLYMVVPSSEWEPGPAFEQGKLTQEAAFTLANRPRFETIIEVVDLERARVLARSRFAKTVGTPFGGGFLAVPGEPSMAEPTLRISRVHLTSMGGTDK